MGTSVSPCPMRRRALEPYVPEVRRPDTGSTNKHAVTAAVKVPPVREAERNPRPRLWSPGSRSGSATVAASAWRALLVANAG